MEIERKPKLIENKDQAYFLVGPIVDDSVREVMKWFTLVAPQNKTRYLIINSPGGNVASAFALVDMLLAGRGTKLVTVTLGQASSVAIPVFLCGTERIVGPRAKFMFHELGRSFGKDDRYSTSEMFQTADDLKRSEVNYVSLVVKMTQISESDVHDFLKSNKVVYAEDATRLGMAHQMLTLGNSIFY